MALRIHGVLAILFGLILLIFPEFGLWTLASVLGFILILIGLGLLLFGAFTYHASKAAGAAFLVLGLLGLIWELGCSGMWGRLLC